MKKKAMCVEDMLKLNTAKQSIMNALKEGKATELATALNEALDTIQNSETEVLDEQELKAKIEEVIATVLKDAEPNDKVQEAIANAIAKRMTAVNNGINKELPVAVRNEISKTILRASGKMEVENAVNALLVKNGISGLEFEQAVDYAVVENWGDLNPLFKLLKSVPYTKFFYSEQDMKDANILAKQWSKESGAEKTVQEIEATAKEIRTRYVYKRQRFAQEDLDEIERAGQATNFLRFVNEELDRMIVNTIVMAILVGDNVNVGDERVTTFETIGSKNASDVFTFVGHPASAGAPTIVDARNVCDKVKNPFMKQKVAIMSAEFLTTISAYTAAAGATETFRPTDEVAKQLGVDVIIIADLLDPQDGLYMVCMLPDGYWYNEKKMLAVSYPEYSKNAINYLKERNAGGAIHDLHSTAVLKEAQA